jgi:DNA-directed RNA polymerase II subunit RPB11
MSSGRMPNPTMVISSTTRHYVEPGLQRELRQNQARNRPVSYKADYESRFELFLLDEGQEKVEEKAETRKLALSFLHPLSTPPPL